MSRRRSPHRHHCVTDELLDYSTVMRDDLSGQLEIAIEILADLFGVASFGERREPHEVDEEN